MPADVTPLHPEERRCQDCGTLAVKRTDEYDAVFICPNDDCRNIVVLAMPMREPDSTHADVLERERIKQFVTEETGRSEREATAILADHNPVAPDKVHAVVALAWARGFIAGFEKGGETFADLLERIAGGERS